VNAGLECADAAERMEVRKDPSAIGVQAIVRHGWNLDRFHRSKGSTEFGNLLTSGEVCLDDRLKMSSGLQVH
jgi:hypothetical protein